MLIILSLALAVIFTVLIYRTAKQNGHNAAMWTAISAGASIILQLVVPVAVTAIIAAVWMSSGKTTAQVREDILMPAFIITVACWVLNIVVIMLIMKKVSPLAEENPTTPPPPTDFNING